MTTKVYVRKNGDALIPASVLISMGIQPGEELDIDIHKPSEPQLDKFSTEIPPDKTVQDFLDEFEQKYQMSSEEIYQKLQNGELDEDPELNDWAIYYSIKLELEEQGKDPSKATFKPYKPEPTYG